MAMNNNFNFGRFGKYFVYDLKRQWKNIGMLVLTFALSPVIFYMLYMFFAALFDGGLMKHRRSLNLGKVRDGRRDDNDLRDAVPIQSLW